DRGRESSRPGRRRELSGRQRRIRSPTLRTYTETERMCGQSVDEGVEADQLLLPLPVGGRLPLPVGARRCEQGRAGLHLAAPPLHDDKTSTRLSRSHAPPIALGT